ncbi:hypothetical protein A0V43_06955 [Geobacillus sp. JS12]|nr:hypothetical protein A0V43_06955 [Geobacillus sp. JS12]
MNITYEKWSEWNGNDVFLFTLTNDRGMGLSATNYGCIVTDIRVPDRNGNIENVVLGFDRFEPYLTNAPSL